MDALLKDLKHAARMFLRAPGFTIAVIGTLGLGIASNTAIFSVVNTVLLKPFAYRDPQRIVMFQILSADDLPHAPKTVVLAYGFWQRQFGGDARMIGRRMTLDGERYEIIGVVGPPLENGQITERSTLYGDIEIHEPPDVYLPFQIDPNSSVQGHFFNVAGRLKPGVTLAAASAQLQASYPEYGRKWPNDFSNDVSFAVQPLQGVIVEGVRNPLLLLLGAVGFVLLIACANVANLLLARAPGRKREIAIRNAVGPERGESCANCSRKV